jgi:hypothetical protein
MEVIWMTALSSDPTSRYRRPLGGAGTGSPSSAASISPFSIPLSCGKDKFANYNGHRKKYMKRNLENYA